VTVTVFVVDNSAVHKKVLPDGAVTLVHDADGNPFRVRVGGGRVLFTDITVGALFSVAPDGSDRQQLATGSPYGVAIDASDVVFFTDTVERAIRRMNVDGTDNTPLLTTTSHATDIALDGSGRMYWAEEAVGAIRSATVTATDVRDIVSGLTGNPYGLALDVTGGKVYFAEVLGGRVGRANIGGGNVETFVSVSGSGTYAVAVDEVDGKIYWVDGEEVRRANRDRTENELVLTHPAVQGIEIVRE
jgi:streptogramin lyase